jgi:hypothetical protein
VFRTELETLDQNSDRAAELRAQIHEQGITLSDFQRRYMNLKIDHHRAHLWLGEETYRLAHDNLVNAERSIDEHQKRLNEAQAERIRIHAEYQEKLQSWPHQHQKLLQEHPV